MSMPAGWRATATTLIDLGGETLRERRKLMWNGSAAATLVIDKQGRAVSAPVVSLRGIEDADGELAEAIVDGPEGDAGRPQCRPSGATTAGSRRRPAGRCGGSCGRTSARSR